MSDAKPTLNAFVTPLTKWLMSRPTLPDGVHYMAGFLAKVDADRFFDMLSKQVAWETKPYEGRPTALYGDEDVTEYRYARNKAKPLPWSDAPGLLLLKQLVEQKTGYRYDVCLCNQYPTGNDRFRKHADREELGNPTPISVISLGAERAFEFTPQKANKGKPDDGSKVAEPQVAARPCTMVLEHGSLLVMESKVHETHLHSLPPDSKCLTQRISLTFRNTKTAPPPVAHMSADQAGSKMDGTTASAVATTTSASSEKSTKATESKSGGTVPVKKGTRVANVYHPNNGVTVRVTRPSKWGNPFRIIESGPLHLRRSRAQAIAQYREWIVKQPNLMADLPSLRGQVLGCVCHPRPCHADVLAELADRDHPPTSLSSAPSPQ